MNIWVNKHIQQRSNRGGVVGPSWTLQEKEALKILLQVFQNPVEPLQTGRPPGGTSAPVGITAATGPQLTIILPWGALDKPLSGCYFMCKYQPRGDDMKPVKYLTQDELKRFQKAVKDGGDIRDRVLYSFLYLYGLRIREALDMTASESVDLKTHKVIVKRSKGGVGREYLLTPELEKLTKKWLKLRETYKNSPGNPYLFTSPQSLHGSLSTQAVQKRMKIYCAQANIPEDKAHPHSLRHSVGVHLLENGKDVHYVSFHLGHTSLKTTMIYLQLAPPEWWKKQRQAVSELEI